MNVVIWISLSLLLLILLILFSPVYALVRFDANDFSVTLKYLFLRFSFPGKKGSKELTKVKSSAEKGKLNDLLAHIKLFARTLGKLISTIRIRDLKIDATIASEDPFQTAMLFGTSSATVGVLLPLLEHYFRIDKRTINVNADFVQTESSVNLFAKCSVTMVQVLAIVIVFAYNFLKERKLKEVKNRKDDTNGRSEFE